MFQNNIKNLKNSEPCVVCQNNNYRFLYSKNSDLNEKFDLYECSKCKVQSLRPIPTPFDTEKYYSAQYFTKRSSRGYDNYFSKTIQTEIERVIELNLKDLNFFQFEKNLKNKKSLDIGCAAGYFVNYLKKRNWDSFGIDVSKDCTKFAQEELKLNVYNENYLKTKFDFKFNLISLWATIEHLHNPVEILNKIHNDLDEKGMVYISTCKTGVFSFMNLFGINWRYYNFPEHIYFFSLKNIKLLLKNSGFKVTKTFTYGSGFGKPKSITRKFSDFAAKHFSMGDMMVIAAQKIKD